MPPWKPAPGIGNFRNSYALTDAERQTIMDWVGAGAMEGDPADAPAHARLMKEPIGGDMGENVVHRGAGGLKVFLCQLAPFLGKPEIVVGAAALTLGFLTFLLGESLLDTCLARACLG